MGAAKLVWTQAWRRLHKKGISETTTKKRTRRANKVQRSVVGASLEDIKKRAGEKSSFRSQQRQAALKEVKSRKAASKGKGGKGQAPKGAQFQKVPKHKFPASTAPIGTFAHYSCLSFYFEMSARRQC